MSQYIPTLSQDNGVGCITNDNNASISIGPGGIFIETGLVSGPSYTATLAYDGLSTTNPDGLQFQSKLDMNNNVIVSADPVSGGNISIGSEEILMVDGNDPQVTQCSIRGSRIAFLQNQFPNRTLTIDPDITTFTNGGFQTNISGGAVTVQSGVGNATLGGASFTANQTATGGVNDPVITLVNQNVATGNSGFPAMHFYKQGKLAAVNDVLGAQVYYGRDNTGAKTEFARIQTVVENSSPGNYDGRLEVYTQVNGESQQVFNFNGGQNEVNSFRPFDLNGNALKTASGNLPIDARASTGTGSINVTPKTGGDFTVDCNSTGRILMSATPSNLFNLNSAGCFITGGQFVVNASLNQSIGLITSGTGDINLTTADRLIFTGANLQSANSGGNSGQHLVIQLNGVQYKIALQNM
jgi:hypothetical protein